ncbi:hypothetical protein WJ969_12105 [Achromobacter xylosoxidans]
MPRIYYARAGLPAEAAAREPLLAGLRHEGFTAVLVPVPWLCPPGARSLAPVDADLAAAPDGRTEPLPARLARDARSAADHGLALLLRLELQRVARQAHGATAPAAWYQDPVDDPARDPRLPWREHDVRQLRDGPPAGFIEAWAARLLRWTRSGVAGYVVQPPPMLDARAWRALFEPSRQLNGDLRCLAWTPGLPPAALERLRGAGFDAVFCSLPWWDYRAPWLAEELERLHAVAPVIAPTCALEGTNRSRTRTRRSAPPSTPAGAGRRRSAPPAGSPETSTARPAPPASTPGCARRMSPARRASSSAATAAPPAAARDRRPGRRAAGAQSRRHGRRARRLGPGRRPAARWRDQAPRRRPGR